jgi:hypothetical protein
VKNLMSKKKFSQDKGREQRKDKKRIGERRDKE